MKRIIEFFVRQSLFGNLITLAVLGIGLASLTLIQREAFPNIAFDIITIETVLPGASPDDTEKLVTNTVEQDLKEVDGIKKIQSYSVENLSRVIAFLDPDQTTEAQGKSDIQDVIDRTTDLPADAKKPVVTSIQSKFTPIIEVAVAGNNVDEFKLRETARFLEDEIEKISGVARVVQRGLRNLEIRVEPNLSSLNSYRLSLEEVIGALKGQNLSVPGGVIEATTSDPNSVEKFVRTTGEFAEISDVENTVIRANDIGQPIRIKDVAKVYYALERPKILNRANGKPSLALTVLKKERADAIKLVDRLKERLEELKPKLGEGITLSYINDVSQFIRRRLSVLTGNMAVGLILVLVLLPLIIPFRFSLMISLGLPFGFLGAIAILYNMDQSINLISMIGLIIVSGMLVDDAIIVTENAVRNMERGMNPKDAAIEGTAEVIAPVTASVLTTVVAFLPMAFMSGIFGKFVKFIPMGVIICLIVSLLEAFFVLPGHIATFVRMPDENQLKLQEKKTKSPLARFLEKTRGFWDLVVVPRYVRSLKILVHHRYLLMVALVVLFLGTVGLATKGMRFILFPPEGVEVFFIRTEAPLGTSLRKHIDLISPIETLVEGLPLGEVDNFTTSVGLVQQDPNDPNTKRGPEYAQIAVYLSPEANRTRKAQEIIDDLRDQVGRPKGLERINFARVNPGPPTGKPVSLGIRGKEYSEILPAVQEIKAKLGGFEGVTDILDSYTLGKEELRIRIKPMEAAAAKLNVAQVANTVRSVFEGIEATKIRRLDEEIVVRVSLEEGQRTSIEALNGILVQNALGQLIPLSQISSIESYQSVLAHEHEDNERQVRITAEIDVTKTSSLEVNGALRKMLPELKAQFPRVSVDFGGEEEDTNESLASLARAFGLAGIGILLILILTFKSLLQPLLVMLTIPLGVIAVIWTFFLHGMPLSFFGLLGIVALSGVIVNNAIVFVDFVNQRRRDGHDRFESIYLSATMRVRPIFLTTMTTVMGVLPTAYGIGGLDKFVVPIAMALGWGIAFGSVLTAFVFPAALAILDDISEFTSRLTHRNLP